MNTKIATIICLFFFAGMVHSNATTVVVDSLFSAGNTNYSNEQYVEAISNYEMISKLGYESAELYFNLGNAFYKQRNYPKAILNYERSLLINPLDQDVLFNLEKAKVYTVDKIEIIPKFVLKRVYNGLLSIFSSNAWALISIISFLIAIGLLFIYYISGRIDYRRISFITAVMLTFISVICFTLSKSSQQNRINSTGAIIMSATVTVKGSPNSNSTDLFIIHEGTKVFTVDKLDRWHEIKLSDGKQGWVQSSDLELI